MPDPSIPCKQPSLKQPDGPFRDGRPQGLAVCSHLLHPWTPHAVRHCPTRFGQLWLCLHLSDFLDGRIDLRRRRRRQNLFFFGFMGVRQGVAMDFLKFHPGPPCPTLLRPAGGPPLKQPAGQAACGRLLPLWTPHAVRLCSCHTVGGSVLFSGINKSTKLPIYRYLIECRHPRGLEGGHSPSDDKTGGDWPTTRLKV
jgi:hypothetical protein